MIKYIIIFLNIISFLQKCNFTFTFHFHAPEKEMATHFSVLAWRIPGMGEPVGLPSMGSHRVGHDWRDLAAAAAASIILYFFFNSNILWKSFHSHKIHHFTYTLVKVPSLFNQYSTDGHDFQTFLHFYYKTTAAMTTFVHLTFYKHIINL